MCNTLPLLASGSSAMMCSLWYLKSMFVNQKVRSRQTAYSIALPEAATYGWCAGGSDKSPISVDDDGVPTQVAGASKECPMLSSRRLEDDRPRPVVSVADLRWPDDPAEIPDWVYTDQRIFELEQERIFLGPTWNYIALEAELPRPGDSIRSYIGGIPIIVARDQAGAVHAFENRCAHRGVEFCKTYRGNNDQFVC